MLTGLLLRILLCKVVLTCRGVLVVKLSMQGYDAVQVKARPCFSRCLVCRADCSQLASRQWVQPNLYRHWVHKAVAFRQAFRLRQDT